MTTRHPPASVGDLIDALECARDLADGLHHGLAVARECLSCRGDEFTDNDELELHHAFECARALDRALERTRGRWRGRTLTLVDLVRARAHARNIFQGDIAEAIDDCYRRAAPPGRVVCAVTALAGRLLPATYRARYVEEFHSELFELRRRSRLAYAARQVASAPATRRSLAEKLPTRAAGGGLS